MGILDGIEKLITEHGSAAILRERIALAKDEHLALEKKNATLHQESGVLKQENAALKEENSRLKLQNEQLNQQIQTLTKRNAESHGDSLDELSEKMLVAIANTGNRRVVSASVAWITH